MKPPVSIHVLGLHPVTPTLSEINAARDTMWVEGLVGEALETANHEVKKHFAGLYLIEIEVFPADSTIDWLSITQPIPSTPENDWQVPWDERKTDEGRWAFFLHFVQLDKPLRTSVGLVALPDPSPVPPHLADVKYDVPG